MGAPCRVLVVVPLTEPQEVIRSPRSLREREREPPGAILRSNIPDFTGKTKGGSMGFHDLTMKNDDLMGFLGIFWQLGI